MFRSGSLRGYTVSVFKSGSLRGYTVSVFRSGSLRGYTVSVFRSGSVPGQGAGGGGGPGLGPGEDLLPELQQGGGDKGAGLRAAGQLHAGHLLRLPRPSCQH